MNEKNTRAVLYNADEYEVIKPIIPHAVEVPYGTDTKNQYYDGYPQIVKGQATQPKGGWQVRKNVMVPLRDGVNIAIDVYHSDAMDLDAPAQPMPVILCWGEWGKDSQDIVAWMQDTPQVYWDAPFWNGSIEGCDFTYTVPRGYIHVIAEPRGIGNSQGVNKGDPTLHDNKDIYDTVEWIAAQPWCSGKVVMMGPSSYSRAQLKAGQNPAPHLVCLRPDEAPEPFAGEDFTGMWDPILTNVHAGRHANDQLCPTSYTPGEVKPMPRVMEENTPEEFAKIHQEILDDPDVKYNLRYYADMRYPMTCPAMMDDLAYFNHPTPIDNGLQNISRPMYIGCTWMNRLYEWGTFEAYRKANVPDEQKKLIVYPPMFPSRPYAWYHDENIRWFDYWVKGIDNGIADEPRVKLFVMGKEQWKFENEFPIARTQYEKFYLQAGGGLAKTPGKGEESFFQPAPYKDCKVYSLQYRSAPFESDVEMIGHMALHFDASIDIDDTNWMADVVDVSPDGTRRIISSGALKAKFRALDEEKSTDFHPIHPRQEGVPVVPGQVNRYDLALTPTANYFFKGHCLEVIIRSQDDMMGRMAKNGVHWMPFMRDCDHTVVLDNAYLTVPVIPKAE